MNLLEYFQTWDGALEENKRMRLANVILLGISAALTVKVFFHEPTVIIKPQMVTSEFEVNPGEVTQSFQSGWAGYFAYILGNFTPETVRNVDDTLAPFFSPEIYNEATVAIEKDAQAYEREGITQTFSPKETIFEPKSGKVFVYGLSYRRGPVDKPKRVPRTFEFKIGIHKMLPVINHIQGYDDKPRTTRELERIEQREERNRRKEAKKEGRK